METKKIKYTTDGKKVVVIGKLNAQETIVQEIFISGEAEIPSGENFVVKSLHNEPSISWKEREIDKISNNYSTLKKNYDELEKDLNSRKKRIRLLIDDTIKTERIMRENDIFQTIKKLLCGEINFIVIESYNGFEVVPLNDALYKTNKNSYSSNVDDKLKMITLFGSKDFEWRLNDYSDGSGGNKKIYPCENESDAKDIIKNICAEYIEKHKQVNENIIKASEEYNFEIPSEMVDKYIEMKKEGINKNILSYKQKIKEAKKSIEELSKKA